MPEKNILHTQYVDNLIVLGTDREAVLEAYQAAVFKFKEAGLQVHGEEVSDTGAKVLGWEIRADGHFGPSLHRAWKVRLAIRELLRRGRATGKQLERLLGHCVFISLGRRESLSVFSDIYRHVQRYRDCHVELPIPRGVRQELIKWDGILPLLRRSLRSKWSDTIHAVDASEWGLGVTDANLAQAQVRKLGQFNERWRFKEPGVARPRDHALVAAGGGSPDETSEHYQVDRDFQAFEPVAFGIVDRPWRTTACYRWKRKLSLPVAEARSTLHAVKHVLRSLSSHGQKHVVLSDSMTAVCAISRGRAHTFELRRVCQQIGALSLATDTAFFLRWVPSEWNPADNPSRGRLLPSIPQRLLHGLHEAQGEHDPSRHAHDASPFCGCRGPKGEGAQEEDGSSSGDSNATRGRHSEPSTCNQDKADGPAEKAEAAACSRGGENGFGGCGCHPGMSSQVHFGLGTRAPPGLPIPLNLEILLGHRQEFGRETPGHVHGWRGSFRGPVPDCSGVVFQPPGQSRGNAEATSGEAELAGVAAPCPSTVPSTNSFRGGGSSREVGLREWHGVGCAAHVVELHALLAPRRGPASEMPRSGETSNQSEALPAVDTGPPSTGAGHSSKTMEFDETLELDLPYHDNVGEALARVAAVGSRDPEEVLFKHSLRDLARFLERGAEALHLQALGPLHPYRLRHGGASHDFSLGLRDLPAIQLRGRWRSAASVRRYQKGGRLAQLFAGLPGEVQRAALKAVSDLSHLCAVVR